MPTSNSALSSELRRRGWVVDSIFVEDAPRFARKATNYVSFGLSVPWIVARAERAHPRYDVVQIGGGDGYASCLIPSRHRTPGRK